MDRPRRRRPSELSVKELGERAIEYRRMALTAHGEATIRSLNMLAARYAALAARREIEASTKPASAPGQSEVQRLMGLAEEAAASTTDLVGTLAETIKMIAGSDADPYLTMGVLVEGAVHILRTSLPPECQSDADAALVQLLIDRLRDDGIPMSHDD